MTADIRTAAQREAERRWPDSFVGQVAAKHDFVHGAVWGADRVTPTREQVVKTLARGDGNKPEHMSAHMLNIMYGAQARAVLKLMQELAEGGPVGSK